MSRRQGHNTPSRPSIFGDEAGAAMALTAIVSFGLFLLIFGSIQYLYGVSIALRNHRTALQVVQAMKTNTPNEQAAYDAAAWVLKLEGRDDVKPMGGLQKLASGDVVLSYNGGVVPHRVAARIERSNLLLLSGFMHKVLGELGLSILRTEAQLEGTSFDSFVSIHLDNSDSMRGPPMLSTTPTIISRLVAEADTDDSDGDPHILRELPDGTNWSVFCWPLDAGSTTAFFTAAQWDRCMKMRAKLPFYFTDRAQPIWSRYDLVRPGPTLISNDPRSVIDFTSYPLVPAGHQNDIDPVTGLPLQYEPYNPGINYSAYQPPGHNLLVCGNPRVGDFTNFFDGCRQDNKNLEPCFPLPAGQQFRMNAPGFSIVPHDSSAAQNCGSSIGGAMGTPCPRLDTIITENDFCIAPWTINRHWLTQEEMDSTPTGSSSPELLGPGLWSQLSALSFRLSNFRRTYLEYAEAFLATVSEVAPLVNLSIFAGPTSGGVIRNNMCGKPYRFGGNRLLFDAIAKRAAGFTGHMFIDEVDTELDDLSSGLQAEKNSGGCGRITGTLPYLPGDRKKIGLIPHLDPATHPFISQMEAYDPDYRQDAYRLFEALSPLDHPRHSVINNSSVYTGGVPNRRGGSWELSATNQHPSQYRFNAPYTLLSGGDVSGIGNPLRFFPDARIMEFPSLLTSTWGIPPIWGGNWQYDTGVGLNDWFPLKDFHHGTLTQLPTPYQPEDVKTIASHILHDISPMMGGTDLEDVFRQGCESCLAAKGGDPNNPLPCVLFAATDGVPNLPCRASSLNAEMSCWGGGDVGMYFGEHRDRIEAQLIKYRGYKNTFTIVLFMVSDPSILALPEYDQFKQLFVSDPASSFFMEFLFTDTSSFQIQFAESLKIVKALIQTYLKVVTN